MQDFPNGASGPRPDDAQTWAIRSWEIASRAAVQAPRNSCPQEYFPAWRCRINSTVNAVPASPRLLTTPRNCPAGLWKREMHSQTVPRGTRTHSSSISRITFLMDFFYRVEFLPGRKGEIEDAFDAAMGQKRAKDSSRKLHGPAILSPGHNCIDRPFIISLEAPGGNSQNNPHRLHETT